MSRYEESTLTPVASLGVVGCDSPVWLCVWTRVWFPNVLYCDFFVCLFLFTVCNLGGLYLRPKSQDISSASGGGGLALNIALSFCQIRFKFRASLKIIGCHPDTPTYASEEMSSFAWTIVVYVGTSGYRVHTSSSSLVLKPRKLASWGASAGLWAYPLSMQPSLYLSWNQHITRARTHTHTHTPTPPPPPKFKSGLEVFWRQRPLNSGSTISPEMMFWVPTI